MNKALNETLSILIAQSIKSKANQPFENAYKAVLATEKAKYVQVFLAVAQMPYQPIEHGWIELSEATESDFIVSIIDPSLPHLHKTSQELWYFAAQSFTIKQLKAIIEESKEDYPEESYFKKDLAIFPIGAKLHRHVVQLEEPCWVRVLTIREEYKVAQTAA